MRGLLLKDVYVLFKQMKIFILLVVIFSVIPGFSMSTFAVVYAALLPVNTMAYDERCHWDELAVMMPYTPFALVFSKYLLSYGLVLSVSAVATAAQWGVSAVFGRRGEPGEVVSFLLLVCLVLVMQAVNLPFFFRFGVEKGRLLFLALMVGLIFAVMSCRETLVAFLEAGDINVAITLSSVLAVLVLFNAVSVAVSTRLYRNRPKRV
ncbi:MAG: ABC-2 transporter permease [Bacillota bacterium]|nr:ABC-2 transporter permease [Bacillota bacterium]